MEPFGRKLGEVATQHPLSRIAGRSTALHPLIAPKLIARSSL